MKVGFWVCNPADMRMMYQSLLSRLKTERDADKKDIVVENEVLTGKENAVLGLGNGQSLG